MITTEQEAEKYFNDVKDKLEALVKLSESAGFNSHAALWLYIIAIWYLDAEEIDLLTIELAQYVSKRYEIHRMMIEEKGNGPFSNN